MWWRLTQDADLGRCWFYLLPQAHEIYNYTMDWFPLKKTRKWAKDPQQRIKGHHQDGSESQRCSLTQNLTSGPATQRHKGPHKCGASPGELVLVPCIRHPKPYNLHCRDELPILLALKTKRAEVQKMQKAEGTEKFLHSEKLTPGLSTNPTVWKAPRSYKKEIH